MRRAVGVVIENAIKYSGPKGSKNLIDVSLTKQGNEAVVTVNDQGNGS